MKKWIFVIVSAFVVLAGTAIARTNYGHIQSSDVAPSSTEDNVAAGKSIKTNPYAARMHGPSERSDFNVPRCPRANPWETFFEEKNCHAGGSNGCGGGFFSWLFRFKPSPQSSCSNGSLLGFRFDLFSLFTFHSHTTAPEQIVEDAVVHRQYSVLPPQAPLRKSPVRLSPSDTSDRIVVPPLIFSDSLGPLMEETPLDKQEVVADPITPIEPIEIEIPITVQPVPIGPTPATPRRPTPLLPSNPAPVLPSNPLLESAPEADTRYDVSNRHGPNDLFELMIRLH